MFFKEQEFIMNISLLTIPPYGKSVGEKRPELAWEQGPPSTVQTGQPMRDRVEPTRAQTDSTLPHLLDPGHLDDPAHVG